MKIIYIIIALINFAFSIDNTTVKTDFDERGLPVQQEDFDHIHIIERELSKFTRFNFSEIEKIIPEFVEMLNNNRKFSGLFVRVYPTSVMTHSEEEILKNGIKVIFKNVGMWEPTFRNISIRKFILEVLLKLEIDTPFSFFALCDPDSIRGKFFLSQYNIPCFLYDRNSEGIYPIAEKSILVPDPYLLNFKDSYSSFLLNQISFSDKKDVCYMRAAASGHNECELENTKISKRLKAAYMFKDDPLFDLKITNICWNENLIKKFNIELVKRVSPLEYSHYKFLLVIDGYVSSWRRVQEVLLSGGVMLLNTEFRQYYSEFLIDNVNCIFIKNDFSDLKQKIQNLIDHPLLAERIALNGFNFAKTFFHPENIQKYYKDLFIRLSQYTDME